MSNVFDLNDARFRKTHASKIVTLCNELDKQVHALVIADDVPADALLAALCQRIGVYLSCTDANKERVVKSLCRIIYKSATK
jgi:hypothetical protein